MDLVFGLDIHFEMVPRPAPIPNPFVGTMFAVKLSGSHRTAN